MTALADTFNRADSATSLGTASDGGTWTVDGGTWGISSNKAYLADNTTGSVRGSDVSNQRVLRRNAGSVAAFVQITDARPVNAGTSTLWVALDPSSGSGYYAWFGGSSSAIGIYKTTATNTSTFLGSVTPTGWIGSSAVLKLTYDGAGSIKLYQNGTLLGTVTDSSPITGGSNTWVGIGSNTTFASETWDDFTADALTAGVALSGSMLSEHTLAGTLTVGVLSGHVTAEHTLAGTLTVAHFAGSVLAEQSLSAALTVTDPLASWSTDDVERLDLPLEIYGVLDVIPVEDPPPASDPYIIRASVTMPTPTLVNGRPQQPWTPSVAYSDWGRLQLIIDGRDMSRPRGMAFLPLTDAHTEPFGDAEASFAFPGLTEFDDPAAWHLTPLAPVRLRRKDPGGTFHTLYAGEVASIEPDDLQGQGLVIQCIGTLYRLDLLKEPAALYQSAQDLGVLIPRMFNDKRRRYEVRISPMAHVTTGIQGVPVADFQPFLTGAVQDHLAAMTTASGGQWTVTATRAGVPKLLLKDTATVHATVSYGAHGVDVKLSKDYTTGTTAVYGSGSNGHCTWMGARFPNLTQRDVPAFPLTVGSVFVAGDGQSGFAPFAAFLRRGQYGTVVSDDTYASADFDNVEQFQDRAHITVDGVVGAQTWEAAFQPGANQGSIFGAYVDTIWEKAATRRRKYNAQGADVGPNPSFDPSIPRIEEYVPFGDNVSKELGRTSAKQIVSRNYPAGRVGTVTLTADPQEMSRFDVDAGMNLLIQNYTGSSVLVHVTRRVRNWQAGAVTLTVDEKARDQLTAASIHQRNKDVSDLTRRQRFGRTKSKVFDDYGAWLCEDGAGELPLMNQQGGFWNTQRIAAAPRGEIARISLALGTGLTEHLLNRNLSSNPPSSIPGAARGCVIITTQPTTPNRINNLPGMGTPLTALADGTNPIDRNQDALADLGMIYAAGGPGQAIGFYPNNDPGDGSSALLTGRFEDGGSVTFGPTGHYWLWVSIWTPVSCLVGGRVFPGAPV